MKILVVDDDATSRRILEQFLKPYGEVDTAANGRDAIATFHLAMAQNEPYKLVCLDIMMPEIDGHEVLKEIRSMEDKEDPSKVIMTTASADLENVKKAGLASCDAYIVKPINMEVLLDKMCFAGLL